MLNMSKEGDITPPPAYSSVDCAAESRHEGEKIDLKKNLGLVSGTALIVGTMIGALSYAELGTMIPKSGGEHAYLMFTFKSYGKFLGPIPAFLFDWLGVFVLRPSMFAIMSLSLGTYATQPFYGQCGAPPLIKKIVTIVAMRDTQYISEGFEGTRDDASVLALSFYNGLWAYDGWNNLNFVTEELKNPHRDLPRSIMIGIPLTTLVYVLVNVGYFAVLSKEEILMSDAVAVVYLDLYFLSYGDQEFLELWLGLYQFLSYCHVLVLLMDVCLLVAGTNNYTNLSCNSINIPCISTYSKRSTNRVSVCIFIFGEWNSSLFTICLWRI
ncbi:hypothetical protein KUTeg_019918 [Tegillarca granosa]|uniref:Uncharacterized protein n=1 Tax=Tegillarca granosa TaxID=220873 RepID=A0ABQ9EIY8_TEGGR|nr:hypothetical protein KUTeg_019918 [Tegillarca granosa]